MGEAGKPLGELPASFRPEAGQAAAGAADVPLAPGVSAAAAAAAQGYMGVSAAHSPLAGMLQVCLHSSIYALMFLTC